MKILLNNTAYDFIKKFVTVTLPALCTLIYTIGKLWGFDMVLIANITGTINAVITFLGIILGFSTYSYNNDNNK